MFRTSYRLRIAWFGTIVPLGAVSGFKSIDRAVKSRNTRRLCSRNTAVKPIVINLWAKNQTPKAHPAGHSHRFRRKYLQSPYCSVPGQLVISTIKEMFLNWVRSTPEIFSWFCASDPVNNSAKIKTYENIAHQKRYKIVFLFSVFRVKMERGQQRERKRERIKNY